MLTRHAPVLLSLWFGNDSDREHEMQRHLWQTYTSPHEEEEDEFLPESADLSEAGWATDFAVTVLGLCFLVTSLEKYSEDRRHLRYVQFGTAWAYFFGGLAHALFPATSDGTGMPGFYVCMTLG